MNFGFEIVEIQLGSRASVYTIKINGENQTELDKFLSKDEVQTKKESLEFITNRLKNLIPIKGAQKRYFDFNEGKATDAVVKIKHSELRCYCLRYGKLLVIAGSGGYKPSTTRARQDKEDLDEAVKALQYVEQRIERAQKAGNFEFHYSNGEITEESETKFKPL